MLLSNDLLYKVTMPACVRREFRVEGGAQQMTLPNGHHELLFASMVDLGKHLYLLCVFDVLYDWSTDEDAHEWR